MSHIAKIFNVIISWYFILSQRMSANPDLQYSLEVNWNLFFARCVTEKLFISKYSRLNLDIYELLHFFQFPKDSIIFVVKIERNYNFLHPIFLRSNFSNIFHQIFNFYLDHKSFVHSLKICIVFKNQKFRINYSFQMWAMFQNLWIEIFHGVYLILSRKKIVGNIWFSEFILQKHSIFFEVNTIL